MSSCHLCHSLCFIYSVLLLLSSALSLGAAAVGGCCGEEDCTFHHSAGAASPDPAGASSPHAALADAAIISGVTEAAPASPSSIGRARSVSFGGGVGSIGPSRGLGVGTAGFVRSSNASSSSSVCLNSFDTCVSSWMVGWNARSAEPRLRAISASPFGPNTSSATTPITRASGAPTPSKEALTVPCKKRGRGGRACVCDYRSSPAPG
mmetsp:Transcript_12620/g.41587  ORF Transcript_12620/g.41587 Transcript_12620/m.41587 type:complete len:207 (+) Transcript_12620:274-894(+)